MSYRGIDSQDDQQNDNAFGPTSHRFFCLLISAQGKRFRVALQSGAEEFGRKSTVRRAKGVQGVLQALPGDGDTGGDRLEAGSSARLPCQQGVYLLPNVPQ